MSYEALSYKAMSTDGGKSLKRLPTYSVIPPI